MAHAGPVHELAHWGHRHWSSAVSDVTAPTARPLHADIDVHSEHVGNPAYPTAHCAHDGPANPTAHVHRQRSPSGEAATTVARPEQWDAMEHTSHTGNTARSDAHFAQLFWSKRGSHWSHAGPLHASAHTVHRHRVRVASDVTAAPRPEQSSTTLHARHAGNPTNPAAQRSHAAPSSAGVAHVHTHRCCAASQTAPDAAPMQLRDGSHATHVSPAGSTTCAPTHVAQAAPLARQTPSKGQWMVRPRQVEQSVMHVPSASQYTFFAAAHATADGAAHDDARASTAEYLAQSPHPVGDRQIESDGHPRGRPAQALTQAPSATQRAGAVGQNIIPSDEHATCDGVAHTPGIPADGGASNPRQLPHSVAVPHTCVAGHSTGRCEHVAHDPAGTHCAGVVAPLPDTACGQYSSPVPWHDVGAGAMHAVPIAFATDAPGHVAHEPLARQVDSAEHSVGALAQSAHWETHEPAVGQKTSDCAMHTATLAAVHVLPPLYAPPPAHVAQPAAVAARHSASLAHVTGAAPHETQRCTHVPPPLVPAPPGQ